MGQTMNALIPAANALSEDRSQADVLLDVSGLSVHFGGLKANQNVSFQVRRGEIFGLIGPNGAGKSTCFNTICGVYRPKGGTIRFKGAEIQGRPAYEVARAGIGRTFQLTSLFLGLSALENVETALHLIRHETFFSSLLGTSANRRERRDTSERAFEVLERLGLEDVAQVQAAMLNFSQQRRLEIAVAIAARPDLLLLDEPAAGMNGSEAAALIALIKRLRDDGFSILLIEHNMHFVMSLCDKICVLNYGEKFAEGTPQEIASHVGVRDIYLGGEIEDA